MLFRATTSLASTSNYRRRITHLATSHPHLIISNPPGPLIAPAMHYLWPRAFVRCAPYRSCTNVISFPRQTVAVSGCQRHPAAMRDQRRNHLSSSHGPLQVHLDQAGHSSTGYDGFADSIACQVCQPLVERTTGKYVTTSSETLTWQFQNG
ncbi:hypothetical protein DENSPDRAFT_20012 [Dentipellis sp. KUC8613]|nr:hypothetical protein DENSPDRAFT_20012 [Dentipellis sp. KUC8613]